MLHVAAADLGVSTTLGIFGQQRIYPNLNPSAAVPVDREQIFSLANFADNYRMRRGKEHGQYVPNARFTFVKLTNGETLLHQRFRHPVLAEGRPVLYAGEAHFNNGKLDWWSNGSGNYRPDPDHAAQAGLPVDHFFTHDQILKGVHTQARAQPPKEVGRLAAPVQAKFAVSSIRRTPVLCAVAVPSRMAPSELPQQVASTAIQTKIQAITARCGIALDTSSGEQGFVVSTKRR